MAKTKQRSSQAKTPVVPITDQGPNVEPTTLETPMHSRQRGKRRKTSKPVPSTEDAIRHGTHDGGLELAASPTDSILRQPKRGKTKGSAIVEPHPGDFKARVNSPWKIGAHVSAAGGVENAIVNAAKIRANAFALFLKSQRRWVSPPLSEDSIRRFKQRMDEFGYDPAFVLPHGSYLINLANPDVEKQEKSYEAFLDDLQRCEQLGLLLYNFHPGSSVGQGTADESIKRVADCINRAHKETERVVIVIENMAGSGNILGGSLQQLADIIQLVEDKSRVGVCLDTCHTFAAGYDIRSKEQYDQFMGSFQDIVGLQYLRGMHINDSKTPLNSKKDRHETIGMGEIGLEAFRHIVTDPRTKGIPLILETPNFDHTDLWKKEIDVLYRLSEAHCPSGVGTSSEGGGIDEPALGDEIKAERVIAEQTGKGPRGQAKPKKDKPKPKAKGVSGRKRKRGHQDSDEESELTELSDGS